jgi:hypothetical protein
MRKSLLVVLAAGPVLAVLAQPAPKINSLSREWLQRDTTAEITVNGENLAAAKRLIVSGAPGVKAEIIQPPGTQITVESSGQGITSAMPTGVKALKVRVEVDRAALLVDREVRVVTAHGVSNPLPLRLSALPEVDAADNETREKAQAIASPVILSGTIKAAAQSHFYKFAAKKGEKVVLNVDAHRLGSKLDSSLAVLDGSGKELARNEDAVGLDSVLEFEPPQDGEYVAELRDFSYQGSGEHKYRLTAGVLPQVRSVFPFGGQRGKTVELQLTGANLGGTSELVLNLAPDADTGRQEIRAATALGLSNPFPFEVTDLPTFREAEPNSALDQADAISLPLAIDGRINKAGDYDAFKFEAAKDQRIAFEIQAFRYGSPLDAVLTLTDRTGKVLQRNDDAAGSDARLEYTFKEAGEHVVIVEDLLNRGGAEYGYRLTASIPKPDFAVTILPDTPRLRRGGRVPMRVEVNRMNGFDEPVRIFCENLPAGVYAEPVTVPPSSSSAFLVLSATAVAELDSHPLVVKASAGALHRTAAGLSADKPVKTSFLTILEPAPFSISAATLMANIEQSQSGTIQVLVERLSGFSGEIKIAPEGFSTGREPITRSFEFQSLTLKGNESRGTVSLKAKPDSEVAVGQIVLRGEAEVNGHPVAAFSPLVPVGTLQIPFVLSNTLKRLVVTALPSGSASAASEAVFTVKVDRRMGFTGEIELAMEGLPEGVTASIPKIAEKENEAPVKLQATEKAPTGKEVQLTVRGVGLHKDRHYRFAAPPVTLVINAPEEEEKKEPKLANTTATTSP